MRMVLLPRLLLAVLLLALAAASARAQCDHEIAACEADSACLGCYLARTSSNQPAWDQCMAAYEDGEDPDVGVCAALKISCCLHELAPSSLNCMTNAAFVGYARCVAASSSGLECPADWSSCQGVEVGPLVTPPPATAPLATASPVTALPATAPPVTAPPATAPPATAPPATAPPVTAPPATAPPTEGSSSGSSPTPVVPPVPPTAAPKMQTTQAPATAPGTPEPSEDPIVSTLQPQPAMAPTPTPGPSITSSEAEPGPAATPSPLFPATAETSFGPMSPQPQPTVVRVPGPTASTPEPEPEMEPITPPTTPSGDPAPSTPQPQPTVVPSPSPDPVTPGTAPPASPPAPPTPETPSPAALSQPVTAVTRAPIPGAAPPAPSPSTAPAGVPPNPTPPMTPPHPTTATVAPQPAVGATTPTAVPAATAKTAAPVTQLSGQTDGSRATPVAITMSPTGTPAVEQKPDRTPAPAAADEYTVQTCADLADVDDTLATGLTIDSSTFACDEYTRFRVRNTLALKATVPTVEFTNFSRKVLGELTVEPDVVFTGVEKQVKNGGVIYVQEGGTATFMGTTEFKDNSVLTKALDTTGCAPNCFEGPGVSYVVKKGGAVHNKGVLTFEGDGYFARNEVHDLDGFEAAKAGAISNAGMGSIFFKGKLIMKDNTAHGDWESMGGAVFNRGSIVVDGKSSFTGGVASKRSFLTLPTTDRRVAPIYQTKVGTMTFNAAANFSSNHAFEMRGGAISNDGGAMTFTAGSFFDSNSASGSGDGGMGGAIFNGAGGVITLMESNTFRKNDAHWGGAIFNNPFGDTLFNFEQVEEIPASVVKFPDETVFDGNTAEHCPDVNNGGIDDCPAV